MARHSGRNQGAHVLADFVCTAIAEPSLEASKTIASAAADAENEGKGANPKALPPPTARTDTQPMTDLPGQEKVDE